MLKQSDNGNARNYMNNRYLFLSASFSKNANAECIKRVVKELPNLNDVYAVTYNNTCPKNDFGIEEIQLPLRPWDKLSMKASKREKRKIIHLFLKGVLFLKRLLMSPAWPVYSLSCAFHFYKSASTIIKEKQITHVIAVCYPGDSLLAMCLLKLRYAKKIKTIMYPLDVFVCGKYDGFAVEKKISSFFSLIFSNICAMFSDRIIVLENAIDCYEKKLKRHKHKFQICGLPLIHKYEPVKHIQKNENIHFVYGGNIIKSIRNPDYLFKILNDYCRFMNEHINIDIYGSINKQLMNDFVSKYNFIKFNYFGWVSEEELSNAIGNANAVISVGNSVEHLIPSKIFKYMSLKKPIIHLNFIDDDPCLPYLRKYGHTFFVKKGIDVDLNDFSKWLRSLDSCEISLDCEKLFPQCTPAYTARVIQSC
jgi:hypothetical protein